MSQPVDSRFCELCQLPSYSCPHGMVVVSKTTGTIARPEPLDWEALAEQAERGMTGYSKPFEASWDGMCPCGVRWEPGDLLVWSPDDGQPVHQVCPGDED